MWLVKIVVAVAVVYAAIVALMYAAQTWLLFPTGLATFRPTLPASAQRLEVATADGETLRGVAIPPVAGADGGDRLLVVGFGGNAWNADGVAEYLRGLYPRAHVVAFHFRGYAPSTGRPSMRALLADAAVVHDRAVADLNPARVVAVGFSIGAGVAVELARERPVAGLILVTPFDSLTALAREHYFWAPVGLLLRHRMETAETLRGLDVPTAAIAAERDTIVPPRRTEPVRRAARRLVFDRTIPGAGHNDLYGLPAFRQAMVEALARIEAEAGAAIGGRSPDRPRPDRRGPP